MSESQRALSRVGDTLATARSAAISKTELSTFMKIQGALALIASGSAVELGLRSESTHVVSSPHGERGWDVRPVRPGDRPAVRQLMERAFGSGEAPLGGERWDWLFGESSERALGSYLVADTGERLAGQLAGVPVRLRHHGEPTTGLMMVDMATDPEHRKEGVFTTLARQIYADSRDIAPIVFGFPNPTAAPLHCGLFEWVELRPFPLLLRPLGNLGGALQASGSELARLGRVLDLLAGPLATLEQTLRLAAIRESASVVPLEGFGDWADELWNALLPDLGTCAVRDREYLNWRFCAAPYRYRIRR